MLPESQGLEITSSSPLQVTVVVDKGFATSLPPSMEEEKVQKEREEEPQQVSTNEVSREGQMVEYPQQDSQDTNVRTMGSTKIETIEDEPSQRERTLEWIDKGKGVA